MIDYQNNKSKEQIKIARLERKIEKVRLHRDSLREKYEDLIKIMEDAPFIRERYHRYSNEIEKLRIELKSNRDLTQRVKEQALLIEKLTEK